MQTILIVVHVFLAAGLIGLILIQHGKGADAGAAFGGGASSTMFGAQGSANFLSRSTGVLAAAFFATSLGMGWFSMQTTNQSSGLMDGLEQPEIRMPSNTEMPLIPGEDEIETISIPGAGELSVMDARVGMETSMPAEIDAPLSNRSDDEMMQPVAEDALMPMDSDMTMQAEAATTEPESVVGSDGMSNFGERLESESVQIQ